MGGGGGERTDNNGQIIKELMNSRSLVCSNDGSGTRIDVRTGKESILDLTFLSRRLAPSVNGKCMQEVLLEVITTQFYVNWILM